MSSESPPAREGRPRALGKPSGKGKGGTRPVALGSRLADAGLIAAFLGLTFLLGVFPLKDTDFWWHLRTGDLIRQTGRIPRTDWYTYTVPQAPWIDLHWGFQVVVSWMYARAGIVGLNLAKCAVTCLAVGLLITARRREWPVWVMVLAWLPALLVLGGRMYVRPETLSLLYLSVFLAVLSRWDRWPVLALVLPVVELAWVNSHGLFVFGPVVLVFALLAAALRPGAFAVGKKRWWRIAGTATALTGLACFANPYGLSGALYPLELAQTMRSPVFTSTIAELTPIPLFIRQAGLRNLPLWLHFLTLLVGALSFLVPLAWTVSVRLRGRRASTQPQLEPPGRAPRAAKRVRPPAAPVEPAWRLDLFRLLLFGAFSLLSWQATRNSHQFAAVVGAVTAWNFGEWAAAVRLQRKRTEAPGLAVARRLAAFGVVAVVFALVASGQLYAWAGEGRTIGLGEEPLWYPHEAVRFAGRLDMPDKFLAYHNGIASLYEYEHGPRRKVYADARLEVIGPALYERYLDLARRISTGDPAWPRLLDDIGRPVVLTDHPHNAPVGATLLASSSWRCVWFDPLAAVFVHQAYRGVVEAHAVDFAARHYHPEPADEPRGTAALLASAKALALYAGLLQAQGRGDLARKLVLLGGDHARRVIQADPDGLDGWKQLALLELAREPAPAASVPRYRLPFDPVFDLTNVRATYALRRALAAAPRDFLSLLQLARLWENARGMHQAALPLLDRLIPLHPINPMQAQAQAELRQQRARLVEALGPDPGALSWRNLSELDQAVSALLRSGRVETAAEFLERAYPGEPRPWDVTDRLATLRLHLGEPARARSLWAGSTQPPGPALRAARIAVTYLVENDLEAARRSYREALDAAPDLFEAAYGLAVLEQDAGRAREAATAARIAERCAPDDVLKAAARLIASDLGE